MSRAGVAPAACLQRAFTFALMPWKLAVLGVICSLAGLPLGRSCLRRVCPKKSNPVSDGGNDGLRPSRARRRVLLKRR